MLQDNFALRLRYDSQNRLYLTQTELFGHTLTTQYRYGEKNDGKIQDQVYGVALNGTTRLSYTYDGLTRRIGRTLNTAIPFVTKVQYSSNAANHTTASLVSGLTIGNDVYAYTYDANGNILTVSKNNALQESYEYDALGQLTKVT